MSMHLMLALAAEHKQRTGHDVWREGPFSTLHIHCDVCLHLGAEKREHDEAEERHYREMLAEADAEAEPAP